MRRIDRYKNEINLTRKKIVDPKKRRVLFFESSLFYGFIIFGMAELVNWFFGLKQIQTVLSNVYSDLDLQYLVDSLMNYKSYVDPYIELEKLEFLKDYVWITPFFFASGFIGFIHTFIYEEHIHLDKISKTILCLALMKLLVYALPYGVFKVLLNPVNLQGFLTLYYFKPLILMPICFFAILLGSEVMVTWIKHTDAQVIMDRYK
jgi:hypothetical protein